MADQLGLFGEATPLDRLTLMEGRTVRAGDPDTSLQAATVPDKPERFIDVLRSLAQRGEYGATDDELCRMTPNINHGTLSKRRLRLEKAGLVDRTEDRRLTRDQTPAIVFVINQQGREVLAAWER